MNLEKFRNLMAENGHEFTPEQAGEVYKNAKKIIRIAKRISQVDIWNLIDEKFDGFDEKEKNQIVDLYRKTKEIYSQ